MAAAPDDVIAQFADLEVLGVLLFGSQAAGTAHAGSDLDVCVVAGPNRRVDEVAAQTWRRGRPGMDVKVFEELPLWLKGEVLDHGQILVARDAPALHDYLWRYQRIWADQRHRAVLRQEDVERLFRARKTA